MSRSNYSDDLTPWSLICWRGAVASAIRGKRGQAFLREMLAALDAMPSKRLIVGALEHQGEVCALGSVGRARQMNMAAIESYDPESVGSAFGVPRALVAEIEFENDEDFSYYAHKETPEARWLRMRTWVASKLTAAPEDTRHE